MQRSAQNGLIPYGICGILLSVRVDKFLKVSRLVKRREVAKQLCDAGDIQVNGKVAKPSTEVDNGDRLLLHLGRHTVDALIKEVRPYANKSNAGEMFEIISDVVEERN